LAGIDELKKENEQLKIEKDKRIMEANKID